MNKTPLVSLCIPTYNRGDILKESLDSYVNSNEFDDEIEIVISDNASTDNTQEIGQEYAGRFPNVKYYRNEENVRDRNFPLSMDRATGEYIKLMKDNIIISGNGLRYLKESVREEIDRGRKLLFFTNGFLFNSRFKDRYECEDFGDFIVHTSYRITSITFFGCWREQWQQVINREKYSSLQLAQDDWVYQLLSKDGRCTLYTKNFFRAKEIGGRSGYNWFQVHVTNYYLILKDYEINGGLSKEVIKKEKQTYLKGLKPQIVHKYMCELFPEWEFDMDGASSILWEHFKSLPYFYFLMLTLPFWGPLEIIKYKIWGLLKKIGWWEKVKSIIIREA